MIGAPVPPPGSVIAGKYRVERVLGSGGMAVVVEATHLVLGQRVAIKLLRADAAQAPGVVERFRQEAQIAAQLPGDHTVRVTDVGQAEGGEPYLVMELLVGRDLEAELLARGALPVDEAVDILLQACEGVAEAHAAGLIHRDLKPGNLFITRRRDGSPHVKVLDFGISKLTRGQEALGLTQTANDSFGTPLYMSPEQIQSAKHVDASSDQHALGAILFTLLAAAPPFVASSVTALSVVIATQPPPSVRDVRPDVPVRLDGAIMKSLAKRPSDRFRDLAELAYAIAPFGGAGSDASVRRISGTLSPALQAAFDQTDPRLFQSGAFRGLVIAPPPSDAGFGAPPGYVPPPGYGSQPGFVPVDPHVAHPSYAPPSSHRRMEPFAPRVGQTSAALETAVTGERGGSKKLPFALAVIGASALTVAVLVAVLLLRFGPRRGAEAQASDGASGIVASASVAASESAPMVAPAAASEAAPEASSAPVAAAGSGSASASASASAAAPSTEASPASSLKTASPAPLSTSTSIKPHASSSTAPPHPSTTTKAATTKKPVDPAKVFGAKR